MSDCGCEKARAELEEYLHEELGETELSEVREHLETCVDCKHEEIVGRMLTLTVRRACKEVAPERLRVDVIAAIRSIEIRTEA
ncbi:zf-HC2 domain-containing protein [Agromyces seonyuensis]|uniref:Alpha-ketoglutarate decarboxylase n=1 Tax=Agromyces seonyuensis TaxID=2662446 RepID=A0A6I4P7Z7_9MICO|nr:zf-HC2 domain-containing protein [Agromyces seonyuensis]MWB99947.1 alpha-ketoglutarate decarboxylase [Agromyces seonyuensis]